MKRLILGIIASAFLGDFALATDVQWSRFRGTVKSINGKTSSLTIQNKEGDLFTIKVDEDVEIVSGKEVKKLRDIAIDDKVVLVYMPKAPAPKDPDEPESGGVYKPLK